MEESEFSTFSVDASWFAPFLENGHSPPPQAKAGPALTDKARNNGRTAFTVIPKISGILMSFFLCWQPRHLRVEQAYYFKAHGFILFPVCSLQGWWLDDSSGSYWIGSMRKSQAKKAIPVKRFNEEAEWDYLDQGVLKKSRSACICITCQHFNYCCDKHCRTLLTCHIQERLIPHGEHLTSRCPLWQQRREKEIGWCPAAA